MVEAHRAFRLRRGCGGAKPAAFVEDIEVFDDNLIRKYGKKDFLNIIFTQG